MAAPMMANVLASVGSEGLMFTPETVAISGPRQRFKELFGFSSGSAVRPSGEWKKMQCPDDANMAGTDNQESRRDVGICVICVICGSDLRYLCHLRL
jgi:hypothetical protein